jgi:hypothetical protein
LGVAYGTARSVTISVGETAKWMLTIGGRGFAGQTALDCSGAPTGANCTVTPSSLNVSSIYSSTLNVSVTTGVTSARATPVAPPSASLWVVALLACVILPIGGPSGKPGRFQKTLLFLLLLLLCACGDGGSDNSMAIRAGSYTINVTATSGSTTETVPLTLIVQ